jgi:hypothetical protein
MVVHDCATAEETATSEKTRAINQRMDHLWSYGGSGSRTVDLDPDDMRRRGGSQCAQRCAAF